MLKIRTIVPEKKVLILVTPDSGQYFRHAISFILHILGA